MRGSRVDVPRVWSAPPPEEVVALKLFNLLRVRDRRLGGAAVGLLFAATLAGAGTTLTGAGTATALPGVTSQWVGAWAAAPAGAGAGSSRLGFTNQSVRMIVRTSVSGDAVRIRVSDAFGDRNVNVGHATIALPDTGTPEATDVDQGTIRELTFNGGSQSVLVLKGAQVLSDAVDLRVAALQELVVTLYFPAETGPATWHFSARTTSYVGAGDLAGTAGGAGFTINRTSWYFLAGVDVRSSTAIGAVSILGDSLVDGNQSTLGANKRWTDRLAERLVSERPFGPFQLGVLNQGLAGGQLGHDGTEVGAGFPELGLNGLARLYRDGFSQTGVRVVVVCLGINDVQISNDTAATIINGLKQISTQIRERGLVAVGCTITPFEGFSSWTPEKEATRVAVNDYLRQTADFHGVLDFDSVLRDPAAPSRIRADLASADFIHPNDAGYRAMADAIPLNLIQ